MTATNKSELLHDMIENVLFSKAQLDEIKRIITLLGDNKLSAKEVRTQIFNQRIYNMERLMDIVSFATEPNKTNDSLDVIAKEPLDHKRISELEEKNEFLKEVGLKVNYLVNKLSERLQS